jgi:putative ABC transport system substrate-binding protein
LPDALARHQELLGSWKSHSIPIVFTTGSDPVALGYVASLNRPGGNVTGVVLLTSDLGAKRVGLLRQLVPKANAVGVLVNPTYPVAAAQLKEVQAAAASINVRLIVANASADRDFEPAFALIVQQGAGAFLVEPDPFFYSRRDQIVALAARYAVPAIYEWREYAVAGGLMSYGTSVSEAYRLAGVYTGRVLKGDKPADLPVMQTTKFEFVINLKTAKTQAMNDWARHKKTCTRNLSAGRLRDSNPAHPRRRCRSPSR